jgi:hypothetical protein
MIWIVNFGGGTADMVIVYRWDGKYLPLSFASPRHSMPTLNAIREAHVKTWQIVLVLLVLSGMALA